MRTNARSRRSTADASGVTSNMELWTRQRVERHSLSNKLWEITMRKMIFAAATLAALAAMPVSSNAQSGAGGGAIVGAGPGAVIGGAVGGGRGAAVGAVVGGTTGAAIGAN